MKTWRNGILVFCLSLALVFPTLAQSETAPASWMIEDVLGDGYYLLAFTPERGNCYANTAGVIYFPATKEIGTYLGNASDGIPIVQITGILEGVSKTTWDYSEQSSTQEHEEVTESTQTRSAQVMTPQTQTVQTPQTTPVPTTAPSPASTPTGMRNALEMAKSYLEYSAFSFYGLVDQLKFEGFTQEEAVYGASNVGADWNAQAVRHAKSYLETLPFSYKGLVEQLKFEKYTDDQAVYGASNAGADWNAQAAKMAASYLSFGSFSREGLYDQLKFEGFTDAQAAYGLASVGY